MAAASTAATNIDELLQHTIGKRVVLAVCTGDGASEREVAVRPVNLATEKGLLYRGVGGEPIARWSRS